MKRAEGNNGFTLLEVLIAMVILAIGLLGTAGMLTASTRANAFAQRMTVATYLIQDKIEEMKNMDFNDDLFHPTVADPNFSDGTSPATMTDIDTYNGGIQSDVTPQLQPNGKIWEYKRDVKVGLITYNRIWTVERNPDINGNGATDPSEQRTMRIGGVVTWTSPGGKEHTVRLATNISQ